MPDSIMDQVRAQQAAEQANRDTIAQRQRDAENANRAKFAREAPEIISIMRQYNVAPQRVVMCDRSNGRYKYLGVLGHGWLINGRFKGPNDNYPETKHVALMEEEGYCIPCVPPASDMPRETAGSLVVIKGALQQPYWGMDVDASREVRRLIGE